MLDLKRKAVIQRINRNARRKAKRDQDKLKSTKPHRTPNRFMLYRKHVQELLYNDPEHPNDMRNLSREIGAMWKKEPPEIKKYWDRKAAKLKLMSKYRSSFDRVRGLNMTISEDELPFVNATASSTTVSAANNENYCTSPISFIFESPESDITSNSEYSDNGSVDSPPQMVETSVSDDAFFSSWLDESEDCIMDNSLFDMYFDLQQYGDLPPLFMLDENYPQ
ncbi:3965_t:CDS:1 [Funneliformis caledonium]|uniref:3965_t:CDS:1 n=1 Tax=Funneliformis caledonium TaxID=1117310 RepID=A0A9N9BHJ6_9GLOM|nr:3965_t:CDS:1 [Funneliformis caledonium]